MKKSLAVLLAFSVAVTAADPVEPIGDAAAASVQEAKSVRWKANLFAGTALLAVVAGIVVICLDGGTSTSGHKPAHDHCDHHHHHHKEDYP